MTKLYSLFYFIVYLYFIVLYILLYFTFYNIPLVLVQSFYFMLLTLFIRTLLTGVVYFD
jgi:hypothetical protein